MTKKQLLEALAGFEDDAQIAIEFVTQPATTLSGATNPTQRCGTRGLLNRAVQISSPDAKPQVVVLVGDTPTFLE